MLCLLGKPRHGTFLTGPERDRALSRAQRKYHSRAGAFTVIFENATLDFNSRHASDGLRLFEKGQTPRTLIVKPGDGYLGELSYMLKCIARHPPSSPRTTAPVPWKSVERKTSRLGQAGWWSYNPMFLAQPLQEGVVVGQIVLEAMEAVGTARGDVLRKIVDVEGGGGVELVGGDGVLIDRRVGLDGTDFK